MCWNSMCICKCSFVRSTNFSRASLYGCWALHELCINKIRYNFKPKQLYKQKMISFFVFCIQILLFYQCYMTAVRLYDQLNNTFMDVLILVCNKSNCLIYWYGIYQCPEGYLSYNRVESREKYSVNVIVLVVKLQDITK